MWNKISKWGSNSTPTSPVSRSSVETTVNVTEVTPIKKSLVAELDYDEQLATVFIQRKRDLVDAMKDPRKVIP